MSKSASSGHAKRQRAPHGTTPTNEPAQPMRTAAPLVSADQRRAMIAECAYFRAAARGFSSGDAVADWLASECEVDLLLSGGSH
jgi:Protein of unknown function (DUF2934)